MSEGRGLWGCMRKVKGVSKQKNKTKPKQTKPFTDTDNNHRHSPQNGDWQKERGWER